MSVYKRGDFWQYRFMFRGVLIIKSSKSKTKSVAERLEREHRRQLEFGQRGLKQVDEKPKKFSDAVDDYLKEREAHWAPKTRVIHNNSLAHLKPVFGNKILTDIISDDIHGYQRTRKKEGASGRSVNIEVSLLRLVMRKHKLWANISDDVHMLKENRDVGRELSDDEINKLLAAAKASASRSLYPAILVSIHTGLRSEEIRMLHWRNVDLIAGEIEVGKSKTEGGSGRIVPLSQTALTVLKDWRTQFPDAIPTHYVFPSERYGHMGQKGRTGVRGGVLAVYKTFPQKPIGAWSSAWKKVKKDSGVRVRWHDLRHSFVSRIAASGVTDGTIQSIAGWMSPKMIERYSHIRNEAKRKAVTVFDTGAVQ